MATQEIKKEKKIVDANAEMFNYEQRVKTELEAPHKWNNAWGEFFKVPGAPPQEYKERIEYIKEELSKFPQDTKIPNDYDTNFTFKDTLGKDHRRRRFVNPGDIIE